MSSEESMSEESDNGAGDSDSDTASPPKRKVLCRRPLPWRSRLLNNYCQLRLEDC